jgi:hypothetical protein
MSAIMRDHLGSKLMSANCRKPPQLSMSGVWLSAVGLGLFSSLLLLAMAPACAIESYDVLVKKAAPTIERRTFKKRSEPKLAKGEKGRTDTKFQLGVHFEIDVIDTRKIGDRIMVTIRPTQTEAKLSLPITIWTPEDAPEKFLDHEDGHRKIAERIYDEADALIRFHSRAILGKLFQGEGADEPSAVKSAYQLAASQLNDLYRTAIYNYSRCVNEEYDRLTRHGLDEIDEDEAIDKSFRHCATFLEHLGDAKRDAQRSQYLWERRN